jgi:octaprenyl-diphosphate synthase
METAPRPFSRDAQALRSGARRPARKENAMLSGVLKSTRAAGVPHSLVAEELDQVERILNNTLGPYRSSFGPLVQHLKHYRGKRLRPLLLLLVAKACGKVTPSHHVLAAVVEMIHTATLVHDDVLDDASTRRHVRTVNARWGNKVSILFGDLLFTNAFHLSSTIGDARACEWIGEATNRVCAGELRQTTERGNLDLDEDAYFTIVEGKTAALTECCGRLGAVYAGADPETVKRLAGFGRDLGIAFQIADDVLDLTGSEKTMGKTLGTDLAQRKLTLPLIYLFERLSDDDAGRCRRLLKDEHDDLGYVFEMLRETGAIEAARLKAEAFAEKAREALNDLPNTDARDVLEAIAHWAVRRTA